MPALVSRHSTDTAAEYLRHFPAVLIEGARQVGKSTLAHQLLGGAGRFTTLDDRQTLDAAIADPSGFVNQFPDGTLVIDEVQRMPELTLAVKASIDADRRPGRFLMTGSSTLLRVKGLQDSLAGRVSRLRVLGLSRGEITGRIDDFAATMGQQAALAHISDFQTGVTREDYISLCARGSYPEAQNLRGRLRNRWFDDYLQGVIGRDLSDLHRSVQPRRADSVMRLLAAGQSDEFVKATLASGSGIPASTIGTYVDLLTDVQLFQPLAPWTPNLRGREVGRPKIVVLDSGLAMRLSRVTEEQLKNLNHQEAFGRYLEGFVVAELLKQQGWSEAEFELFHYRDRNGVEVDVVIEFSDGRVLALEVKAATSFGARQFGGLAALREKLGDRFIAGIVLNTGNRGYRYADKLFGLPVAGLWEL